MRTLKINTLKKVSEDWVDRDAIMLHACFQLLVDFVEKEDGLNHCNYESHKESIDDLTGLYEWWTKVFPLGKAEHEEEQEKLLLLIKHRGFLWT